MSFNPLFDLLVILVLAVMITVLVFAHELGHYLFARYFGMGVEEFSIGMGQPRLGVYANRKYKIPLTEEQADLYESGGLRPKLPEGLGGAFEGKSDDEGVLVRSSEGSYLDETTKFTFRAWPVGGFVRIKGMAPEEQGGEIDLPGGFYSKPPWQRWLVLFAGPLFSVLTGLIILVPFLMVVGKPEPNTAPIVGSVTPGKQAATAGIQAGDKVLSLDGKPVSGFYDIVQKVTSSLNKPVVFLLERKGKQLSVTVTPALEEGKSEVLGPDLNGTHVIKRQAKIGFSPAFVTKPEPFFPACLDAISVPFNFVASLASGIIHPADLKGEVGGPVTIVTATADATRDGVGEVVEMAAGLSISLGILNLLPIFPMDGGQMLVAFTEMLRRGRRLSFKAQNIVAMAGLTALAVLVIGVLFIDFQRLRERNATPDVKPEVSAPKK